MNIRAHTTTEQTGPRRRRATAWLASLALALGTLAVSAGTQVLTASSAAAARPTCPGGTDDSLWAQRRSTAQTIAREAAGQPRLVIEDAKIIVSGAPAFEATLGTAIQYSVFADTVVEVAANRKYLGRGYGRVAIKTSASTGCAWALISDKDLRGLASYWVDIAPDARHTESWVGLVSQGSYNAMGRSSTYGPTVAVPEGGAVRACAKFADDGYVTFCSEWVTF